MSQFHAASPQSHYLCYNDRVMNAGDEGGFTQLSFSEISIGKDSFVSLGKEVLCFFFSIHSFLLKTKI